MHCVREFREIYEKKSMPLLYLFIERYKNSELKEISRFANGLEKDIEAVEILLPVNFQMILLRERK